MPAEVFYQTLDLGITPKGPGLQRPTSLAFLGQSLLLQTIWERRSGQTGSRWGSLILSQALTSPTSERFLLGRRDHPSVASRLTERALSARLPACTDPARPLDMRETCRYPVGGDQLFVFQFLNSVFSSRNQRGTGSSGFSNDGGNGLRSPVGCQPLLFGTTRIRWGVGVRYNTPVGGPFRFDIGRNLKPGNGSEGYPVLHHPGTGVFEVRDYSFGAAMAWKRKTRLDRNKFCSSDHRPSWITGLCRVPHSKVS